MFFRASRHPQRPEQWDFLPSVRQRPPLELPSQQHGACSLCCASSQTAPFYNRPPSSQSLSLLSGKMLLFLPLSPIVGQMHSLISLDGFALSRCSPRRSCPRASGMGGLPDWSYKTCFLRPSRTRCPARPGPRLQGCAGRSDGWTCASFRCCTPACRSTPRGPTPAGERRDCRDTMCFSLVYFSVGASKAASLAVPG